VNKEELLREVIQWSNIPAVTDADITVDDYARATGVTSVTARRRLEALVRHGKLAVHEALLNGHRVKAYSKKGA